MLKFIKHHMETIAGVEYYPVISFCLFFGLFLVVLLFTFTANKQHIDHMKHLPTGQDNESSPL